MDSAETAPPTSAISAVTSSINTNAGTLERRRVCERDNLSLFQLSSVPSPLQEVDHHQLEEDYDRRCYDENPGASDSEEEADVEAVVNDDDNDHVHPSHEDKKICLEENVFCILYLTALRCPMRDVIQSTRLLC